MSARAIAPVVGASPELLARIAAALKVEDAGDLLAEGAA